MSRIVRICRGPVESVLVVSPRPGSRGFVEGEAEVSKLNWVKEHQRLQLDFTLGFKSGVITMGYVKPHNLLMVVNKNNEIQALRLGAERSVIWRLSGMVDGLPFKPHSITSDNDGNAYISDGRNRRILKMNSSTGNVKSILLLEEDHMEQTFYLRYSHTEPNLTLISGERIVTYNIP